MIQREDWEDLVALANKGDPYFMGYISAILGKPPVPPKELNVQECIKWGNGFIIGRDDGREVDS